MTHLDLSGVAQLDSPAALEPLRSAAYAGDLLVKTHAHALRHVRRRATFFDTVGDTAVDSPLVCVHCRRTSASSPLETKSSSPPQADRFFYRCAHNAQDAPLAATCRDFVLCHACVREQRQDAQRLGSGLRELDLRRCGLRDLPLNLFGDFHNHFPVLEKLYVSGNPLVEPSSELGRRAAADVKSNLFGGVTDDGTQLLRYAQSFFWPQVPREHGQLVTVGHAEMGKSTILKNAYLQPLVQNEPRELQDRGRTTMALFLRMRRSLELPPGSQQQQQWAGRSLWFLFRDLPGQPQFWSSNVHFLSADCAVFLVVLSLALPLRERQDQLDLWLSSLDALAAKERPGRVLIVCTHADQRRPEESEDSIQAWLRHNTERKTLQSRGYRFLGQHVRVHWTPPVVAHVDTHSGDWRQKAGFDQVWNRCARDMARLRKQVDGLMYEMLADDDMKVPGYVQPLRLELENWRKENPRSWYMDKQQALQLVSALVSRIFVFLSSQRYLNVC